MNATRVRPPARSSRPDATSDDAIRVLGSEDATLLDLVDNALSKGVVLTGDVTIGLANVDLVYLRLSLLLCAADRVMPGESHDPVERRHERRLRRLRSQQRRSRVRATRG
jgi:gas vesicle structural protein